MTHIREIGAGIDLLDDDKGKEWVDKIDLDTLDMNDCDYCIFGQLYGEFEKGLRHFGIGYDESVRYGMYLTGKQLVKKEPYNDLTTEWKQAILDLRALQKEG